MSVKPNSKDSNSGEEVDGSVGEEKKDVQSVVHNSLWVG